MALIQTGRTDLEIPEKYRLKRSPGELIVYHSSATISSEPTAEHQGHWSDSAAIDRLKSEGFRRLEFVTDVPSKHVRFIQLADILVDQLNYGRYGAQACEGMMLGRPTICYLNKNEPAGVRAVDLSSSARSFRDGIVDLCRAQGFAARRGKAAKTFRGKPASRCPVFCRRVRGARGVYDRLMNGCRRPFRKIERPVMGAAFLATPGTTVAIKCRRHRGREGRAAAPCLRGHWHESAA